MKFFVLRWVRWLISSFLFFSSSAAARKTKIVLLIKNIYAVYMLLNFPFSLFTILSWLLVSQYLLSSSLQNYSNFGFILFLVSFFSLLKY